MCIIAGPVQSVSKTFLFTSPTRDGRQITVYKNTVVSEGENLMILPVPHPETLQFEEGLQRYKELFSDLAASVIDYEVKNPLQLTRSLSLTAPLPVFSIGSYSVSVCKSVEEIDQLNEDVFELSSSLVSMLKREYGVAATKKIPFGFLCCRLKPGTREYTHIAYSHKTPTSNTLFLPTKHFHGEDVKEEEWDHTIYSLHCGPEALHSDCIPKEKNKLQEKYFPFNLPLTFSTPVLVWKKKGLYKNEDLEFRFNTSILVNTEPESVISKIKGILSVKN
jgi:hypothetical protein